MQSAILRRLGLASEWSREGVMAVLALALGFGALPFLIFQAGSLALGRYEGASAGRLYASIYRGLGEGSPASWIVVFGPYGLYLISKDFAFGGERGPARPESPIQVLCDADANVPWVNDGYQLEPARVNPEIESHLRSIVNFPSPPGVATHIIELARDPDIEMSKVAKALSMDSALSIKVLRIANSPLYAQRRKSENLRQALVVLGLNATLTLALSFSLVKSLRVGKANGLSYPLYWRRALLAATAARALADAMRHPMAEEIFLAALLQDIGMLALDKAVPDLYRGGEALQRDHIALAESERKRLQTDHAEIGGWLMRNWNIPERLHVAIGRSHHIDLAFTVDPGQLFDRCVALSGPVADLFLLEADRRPFAETAQTVERSLGMDRMAFGQVLGTIGAMIPETETIFETDLLAKQHPDLILEQARDVLMLRSLHALREINLLRSVADSSGTRAQELEAETRRDAMTGVYNRAYLDQVLTREFENATRHKWPLSVAFVDLDNFNDINDKFGRHAGDRILQATARLLRGNTRETDVIARYGGEEFVVVLPATDAHTAQLVCERIVAAFQNTGHVIGSDHASVTVSIGSATHGPQTAFDNAADFIKAADQALYTAKMRGRNRSVPFDRQLPSQLAAIHA